MRPPTVLGFLLGLFLLLPLPGSGVQNFEIAFDGFEDLNANGMIDCSETVTYRVALFQLDAPFGPETGVITVPFSSSERWRYIGGSIEPDFVFLDRCTFGILDGNDSNDFGAVLSYSCDPHAGNPLDDNYFFQFRVSGEYLGETTGPIVVDAQNDRTSPTIGSLRSVDASAGPLNPCLPPPDLRLAKGVLSGDGAPGSLLTYELAVTNLGDSVATDVVLEETVPQLTVFDAGNSSAGWTCLPNSAAGSLCTLNVGTLGFGATATRLFAVRVGSGFPPGPPVTIDNTACASSTPADPLPQNNCSSTRTPVGYPDLATAKSVASGSGDPGATLVYNLVVSNLGNRAAVGVQLTETVPVLGTFISAGSSPGWSCTPNNNAGSTCTLAVGTVAAGTSTSRTFAVQLASSFPSNPPPIDNTACSSTTTGGDPTGNNCGSVSTPPGGNPDLRITKSVASGSANPGATLVYSLVVANLGNRQAADVQLTETVPVLSTFMAASSSPGWSCSPNGSAGSTCTLAAGPVAAGASVSRTFAVELASAFPSDPPPITNTACSSTTTGGDPSGNNCASVSTPPGGNPDLRITKALASGNGNPGATLVYSLVVDNIGTRESTGVELTETVPELSTFLPGSSSPGWSCSPSNSAGSTCTLTLGSVAAGMSVSRTFAVQLAATFPADPPPIVNTACTTGSTSGDPSANNCGSISTPPGGNSDIRMTKSVASGNGNPGGVLVYQLAVSNVGTRDAAGVSLEESVPQLTSFLASDSSPGWTCTPNGNAGSSCVLMAGNIAAGSSTTFSFAVQVVSEFPPNPPPIENVACVRTKGTGDPSGNDCSGTSTPPGGNSDVRLSKSVLSGNGDPGSTLVYSLVVSNVGTREAQGVSLEESVPQLTTFLPAGSSPGWICTPDGNAGASCTLPVGTVAAGSSMAFTFAVQVASTFPPNPPLIENLACVSTTSGGDPSGNDCAGTSTPPGGNPDVRLVKSVAEGNASPGSVLLYELLVSNVGTRAAVGVRLEETVPQLTSFLPASSSAGWTCTPDNSAGSSCTLAVGTVAAGGSATFSFAVQVAATLPPNPPPIENSACVDTPSDGDPSGNDCSGTSTPPGGHSDVRLSKSVASGSATPGSVLVYALVVSNVGTRDAAGVSLEETVPQLTSFLPASSSPGWTCTPGNTAGSSCTLAVGTVAAGGSATFTFAVEVAATFPPNPPPIENSACVDTTSDGDPSGNDCSGTSTPPGGNSDLRLVKTLASGQVVPNGVLVFTLTIHNQGNREATGVVLQETVPADSTFEAASSSLGWSCTPDTSAGSVCTLSVGSVTAGASSSYAFAVRLPPDLPSDTTVRNMACVNQAPEATDPPENNCAVLVVDPPGAKPRIDIEVAIGADESLLHTGAPFLFTLTVRNASAVQAEGLRVLVALPSFGTEPMELDPSCVSLSATAIECSVSELAGGGSVQFTWTQAALQVGSYLASAELMEASPEDVDSTPGNGIKSEDDYAEVEVSVPVVPGVHDIPTLSTVGISAMVILLVAFGVVVLKRGATRRPSSI